MSTRILGLETLDSGAVERTIPPVVEGRNLQENHNELRLTCTNQAGWPGYESNQQEEPELWEKPVVAELERPKAWRLE